MHTDDNPKDIESSSLWLAEQEIAATYFVPSTMFDDPTMTAPLRSLPALGHEVGSHGHEHDYMEVRALISGEGDDLGFLSVSRDSFGMFYGRAPVAFRSPLWCYVGEPARRELARLGYQIDSSATPQRVQFLSSLPFEQGWSKCRRSPHHWPEGLLEIPTTSLLQPASIATFASLRAGAWPFLRLLLLECQVFSDRVLALQFHARDFCPQSGCPSKSRSRPRIVDCIPRRTGGLAIRRYLGQPDPLKIQAVTQDIIAKLQFLSPDFMTMSEVANTLVPAVSPFAMDHAS